MPLIKLDAVEKLFPGVRALSPLTLELAKGEVLGLVGENGAGKSTLIKILSGVHAPDGGRILWNNTPISFRTPHDALRAGIATIHQELAYFGHLTLAENLLMGEPWPRFFWGGVRWAEVNRIARDRLEKFDLKLHPGELFYRLTTAQKQEIAIVRALARKARLLILDEPTASLSEPEVERLFAWIERLRKNGVAIIYVSHRLDEITRMTDRIVVLRDGEMVSQKRTNNTSISDIVQDMVGRTLEQARPTTRGPASSEPALELIGATRHSMFSDISYSVRRGEIVGLAGLVGSGRSELARAIYGLYPLDSGLMRLFGRPWRPTCPNEALNAGLIYLPEERKRQGLVLDHSVNESISIGFTDQIARRGIVPLRRERARVSQAMSNYDVRSGHPRQAIGTLSGGNQQKAMLARWLERRPNVIILDEPTRGVDVGAKAEIHALIDRLAASGCAILLISSDLPEILGISDRVLVMHQGTISAEFQGEALTQKNVIMAASGLTTSPYSLSNRNSQQQS